jgi:hypothetical protein
MILRIYLVLSCVLLTVTPGFACSIFPPRYDVPRSFDVIVADRGKPLPGVSVRITRFRAGEFERLSAEQVRMVDPESLTENIAAGITDEMGIVHFQMIRAGEYHLSTQQKGEANEWVDIRVVDSFSADLTKKVELQWPALKVMSTSALRGQIATGLYDRDAKPLGRTKLVLLEAWSYKEIESVETDKAGRFVFSSAKPGLYFLQIFPKDKTEWEPRGDILVELGKQPSQSDLRLAVAYTSCGLQYDLESNKHKY